MKLRIASVVVGIISLFAGSAQGQNADIETVVRLMNEQQECWNKGDIKCFMQHYWNSDSLKFVGGRGVNYGWQSTYDNYMTRYPTKKEMGNLSFDVSSHEMLGPDAILTVGQWTLSYPENSKLGGYFTLTWKRIDGEWKIICDHTN